MIRNLKALLNSRAFKIRPFFTLVNGISLFFIILFNLSTKFEIKLNKKKILFFFKSLRLNKFGGRGFFVFRENIEPLMLCMSKIIAADDTIIDGGANFGMYTILFASQTKNNTVFAIEPFKDYNPIILYNSKINKLKNIKIINKVLANNIASYKIDYSCGNTAASIVRSFQKKKTLQS